MLATSCAISTLVFINKSYDDGTMHIYHVVEITPAITYTCVSVVHINMNMTPSLLNLVWKLTSFRLEKFTVNTKSLPDSGIAGNSRNILKTLSDCVTLWGPLQLHCCRFRMMMQEIFVCCK